MKVLTTALALLLAGTCWAQTPVPTTGAASAPATVEAYIQQVRARYNVPDSVPSNYGSSSMASSPGVPTAGAWNQRIVDLLRAIYGASRVGLPLDVIENVGDARARFVAETNVNLPKYRDTVADLLGADERFPSEETLAAKKASLRDQKARAQLELEVKQAKEKNIQERIAAVTQQVAKMTENDEVLKSLRTLEAVRQKQVERLREQVQVGSATPGSLTAAEAELAATRIDIAKRPTEIAATASGGALGVLNGLLIAVSLEVEEQQTTIKVIDAHLEKLQRAVEANEKADRLNTQSTVLKALQAAEKAAEGATWPELPARTRSGRGG